MTTFKSFSIRLAILLSTSTPSSFITIIIITIKILPGKIVHDYSQVSLLVATQIMPFSRKTHAMFINSFIGSCPRNLHSSLLQTYKMHLSQEPINENIDFFFIFHIFQIFAANTDRTTSVTSYFPKPVYARIVRITCLTKNNGNYWQMKCEVLGCKRKIDK